MNQKLPYLEISGSSLEFGNQLGAHFRSIIQKEISYNRRTFKDYASLLDRTKPYYQLTRQFLPHLIVELETIAQAAQIDPAEYFLHNTSEVFDPGNTSDQKDAVFQDHCTVIVGYSDQEGAIIGHNEDWSTDTLNQLYILKATVNNHTFIGLNYATVLPGLAASMNSFGLVQCINYLPSTTKLGVPKNFIARAVLESQTLDQAENLIRHTPQASGFNHVLIQQDEIRNLEIIGNQIATETIKQKPYVHTNHYLNPTLQKMEPFHSRSSEARYLRAQELITEKMDYKTITTILRDTQNSQYPICRPQETIGSVIFIPSKKEAHFCYGHPCAGDYYPYSL